MQDIIVRKLNDLNVGQRVADGYINATALAKAYYESSGKFREPREWLSNKRTKEAIRHLSDRTGISPDALIQTIKGGRDGGNTWIHPHLAVRFAMWLSDEFAYAVENWVQEWTIKTYTGTVAPVEVIAVIGSAIDTIFANTDINKCLVAGIKANAIAKEYPQLKPYAEEAKALLGEHLIIPNELLTPTQIGELLGERLGQPPITARKVNQLLIEVGLQVRSEHKNPSYLLTDRGQEFGQLHLNTAQGSNKTVQQVKWFSSVVELLLQN